VNEFGLRFPSVLLSTLAIYLTYRISKNLFNSEKIALLAAFFHAVNGLILEVTGGRVSTDHVDLFFLFFVELGVFFATQYLHRTTILNCVFIGLSIGIAVLCKWLTALIVIPVWLILAFNPIRYRLLFLHLITVLFTATVVFLPWHLYVFYKFPLEAKWESSLYTRHLTEVIEGRTGPWYYFLNSAMSSFNELLFIIFGWWIYSLCCKKYDVRLLALWIWFMIPLLFFSFAKTKMQGYLLFTGPAIFILVAHFSSTISAYNTTTKPRRWLINGMVFLTVLLPIRYCIERLKPFQGVDQRKVDATWRIKKLNDGTIPGNTVVFNNPNYIETMFYTSFISYEWMPSKAEETFLQEKGYRIYILPDLKK